MTRKREAVSQERSRSMASLPGPNKSQKSPVQPSKNPPSKSSTPPTFHSVEEDDEFEEFPIESEC